MQKAGSVPALAKTERNLVQWRAAKFRLHHITARGMLATSRARDARNRRLRPVAVAESLLVVGA